MGGESVRHPPTVGVEGGAPVEDDRSVPELHQAMRGGKAGGPGADHHGDGCGVAQPSGATSGRSPMVPNTRSQKTVVNPKLARASRLW